MADAIDIPGKSALTAPATRAHYQAEGVREVRSRARFLEHTQTPHEQAGLKRLDRLLLQDADLDTAAPRGYYLNINV